MLKLLRMNPEAKGTTLLPNRKIEYIVVHYTAGWMSGFGTAINIAADYYGTEVKKISADFIVDDEIAVQYNPDTRNRYTWHCAGKKNKKYGCEISGLCTNKNSIGIEICSSNLNHRITYPEDDAYYFTGAVLKNAVTLTASLMLAYDIEICNVLRHYDVTGKNCPGVPGWYGSKEESSEWLKFKARVSAERDRLVMDRGVY